jgi:hypothetical protein
MTFESYINSKNGKLHSKGHLYLKKYVMTFESYINSKNGKLHSKGQVRLMR